MTGLNMDRKKKLILDALRDSRWHTVSDLISETGVPQRDVRAICERLSACNILAEDTSDRSPLKHRYRIFLSRELRGDSEPL